MLRNVMCESGVLRRMSVREHMSSPVMVKLPRHPDDLSLCFPKDPCGSA